jgi:hypothetical protein
LLPRNRIAWIERRGTWLARNSSAGIHIPSSPGLRLDVESNRLVTSLEERDEVPTGSEGLQILQIDSDHHDAAVLEYLQLLPRSECGAIRSRDAGFGEQNPVLRLERVEDTDAARTVPTSQYQLVIVARA